MLLLQLPYLLQLLLLLLLHQEEQPYTVPLLIGEVQLTSEKLHPIMQSLSLPLIQ